jgi:hypothetical protein
MNCIIKKVTKRMGRRKTLLLLWVTELGLRGVALGRGEVGENPVAGRIVKIDERMREG